MLVYYWVPGDNDDPDHPNAFPIPGKGPRGALTLRDVRARFPLPGTYHFRFKMKWDGGGVWMDVTNEDSAVPMFDEKIYMKVLRITWGDVVLGKAGVNKPVAASPAPAAPNPTAAGPPQARAAPASQAAPARPPPPPAPQEDMLMFGSSPSMKNTMGGGCPPAAASRSGGHHTQAGRGGNNDDFDMLFS